MTIEDYAALTVSILTIITSVGLFIKWMVKHYLSELKPNSGSSLRDSINRLESKSNEADIHRGKMDDKLDRMYDILLEHISKNFN